MLTGKGMYIWVVRDCEGGNYNAIRDACLAANLKHVLIKIADRYYDFNVDNGVDHAKNLTQVLKQAGITVYGWQYTYGTNPEAEGIKGAQRAITCGVNGFVIDAESEYKTPGKDNAALATTYVNSLKNALGSYVIPIGLASYRYPSMHKEFPWSAFRSKVNFDMPQVYWQGMHNPVEQLVASYTEYNSMTPKLPYVPTGSAYFAGGWKPEPQEITDFLSKSVQMGFTGANFWEWGRTKMYAPELWAPISAFVWPEENEDLPKLIRMSSRLNVPVRAAPNGKIIAVAMKGWTMVPTGVDRDGSGKVWYLIDPGWVPASLVSVIEV